jgi:NAD(P)-dependent dehydrogenase (short-subunit alcohol dehydrogenase family)
VTASAAQPVTIVTGAGGNLGAAVVRVLAGAGHRLVAVERTAAALDRALDGLDAGRIQAEPGVDLGDPAACRALVERAMRRFGQIDGLTHTVGAFAMAEAAAGEAAHWERLFQANLFTAVNMCRAVAPAMRAAGRGSIVTVGAAAAARAGKGTAAYASAKSAVLRLTEALAAELKDAGVRANCVLPGTIDTPPNRAAMPAADTSRWVAPAQIAEVIAFLLSDAAAAVTGAAVPVTGRG